MKAKQLAGVPLQYKGAYHDTESKKTFVQPDMVVQRFEILKERFFSINHWKDYCGQGSSDFRLYDYLGYPVDHPGKGDFIRIDIPGPGGTKADGYDWVEIVRMSNQFYQDDEMERYEITCRPSKPAGCDTDEIAHFYSAEATSTFIISRGKDFIKVGIYGRNEVPNYYKKGFLDKVRNFLISLGGSARLTKIQWKCLADGLLDF